MDKKDNSFMQLGEIAFKKIISQIKINTEQEAVRTAFDCMPTNFRNDDENARLFLDGFVDAWKEGDGKDNNDAKR